MIILRDWIAMASANLLAITVGRFYTRPMGKIRMEQFTGFLTDRGSKYAVSGGPVSSRSDIKVFLKELTRDKRFAKATHNSWAALLPDDGPVKGDDGESGAGMVIVRMLEREGLNGHIVVVTRWFGGIKLGGDRFRRVQDAVAHYLEHADLGGDA